MAVLTRNYKTVGRRFAVHMHTRILGIGSRVHSFEGRTFRFACMRKNAMVPSTSLAHISCKAQATFRTSLRLDSSGTRLSSSNPGTDGTACESASRHDDSRGSCRAHYQNTEHVRARDIRVNERH